MCDYCEGCLHSTYQLDLWRKGPLGTKQVAVLCRKEQNEFLKPREDRNLKSWTKTPWMWETDTGLHGERTHCSPCSKKAEEAESLPTTTTLGKHQCKEQLPCFPPWNSKQVLRKSLCAEDFLSWQRTAPRWLVIEKMVVVPTWLVRMI